MDDALISVIVPVYNVEKYLRRCVDSITGQSYQNLEILLVDDGSTDGSSAICDELASRDDRICVIRQPNGGQSVARNTGIAQATGKYIAFIDSDDYVLADYISRLYGLIGEYGAEISITDFVVEYDGSGRRKKKRRNLYTLVMDRHKAMETFLYQRHFITSVCGRLFDRSLFDDIVFPSGKITEEMGVIYRLIDKANRVAYQSSPDYIYVQRETSTMHSRQSDMERDYIELTEEMRAFIEDKYPDMKDAAFSRCFSANIQLLMNIPLADIYRKEHAAVRANIKKYRGNVLVNPKARTINRGCAFLSYFGIWLLKICLDILK